MIEIEEYSTLPEFYEEDFNNVLYVDDEESNLRVFDSVFSRYYNIYTTNNGHTAIEMLRAHEIHMIITDQKMPEMTGTDLLEKTLEEFPDIIRIILTGFADIQAIIKAINKCSIYKYITKPYENAEIKEIIDKGLDIFNIRAEKYQSTNGEILPGSAPELALSRDDTSFESESLSLMVRNMCEDLSLTQEDFESYFDFHISYQLAQGQNQKIYTDLIVNTDEDGSRLFFLMIQPETGDFSAINYLYLKGKLRTEIEEHGNEVELDELFTSFTALYEQESMKVSAKVFSYHWEKNEIEFLGKQPDIKVFSITEQLEPLKLRPRQSNVPDYLVIKATSTNELIVYFWDYSLSSDENPGAPDYFKQIINHVTSVPFDLQASQIASGVKSVSQYFSDATLFGLYFND